MAKYKIAGVVVEIIATYNRTLSQAEKYKINDDEPALFKISLTDEDLTRYQKEYPYLSKEDLEYMFLGQQFYRHILRYNGILLHSSAIVKDNKAYLFSAPSGTGKSTHTGLWLKEFPDAYILNDDKPAIMFIDGALYAAGTPFSGKVDLSRNCLVPLQGICFIERSKDNWIKDMMPQQAIYEILNQTERIPYEEDMDLILKLIEKIVTKTKIYKMGCNISSDAVYTSYNKMK